MINVDRGVKLRCCEGASSLKINAPFITVTGYSGNQMGVHIIGSEKIKNVHEDAAVEYRYKLY